MDITEIINKYTATKDAEIAAAEQRAKAAERRAASAEARIAAIREALAGIGLGAAVGAPIPDYRQAERSALKSAMMEASGNMSAAAAALGIPRSTLAYKLQCFGLHKPKPAANPPAIPEPAEPPHTLIATPAAKASKRGRGGKPLNTIEDAHLAALEVAEDHSGVVWAGPVSRVLGTSTNCGKHWLRELAREGIVRAVSHSGRDVEAVSRVTGLNEANAKRVRLYTVVEP